MGFLTEVWRSAGFRASLENPSFTLNDAAAYEYLGETRTTTGLRINHDTALKCSPWWRGITLISTTVAKVPLHVYRRTRKGKDRDTAHPAYYLLRRKPNPYQTAYQFRLQLQSQAMSLGNGYAYIYRDGNAKPLELWPLDPTITYPVRENGRLWYVTEVDGESRKLPAEDVLHVKGLGFDGLVGYSVVRYAADVIALALAAEQHTGKGLSNGARPGVVLEAPAAIKDTTVDKLRADWERMHTGLNNSHRTAILTHGIKAHTLSFNNEDVQLIQTREFQIRDIANFLGLAPHKLGDNSRTAYASLEQENQSTLDEGYDPWLVNWEGETWDKLLTEREKEEDTHFTEFLRPALVRADIGARANYYATATGGRPWMTPDEVRDAESLNLLGGEAEELLTPLNIAQPTAPQGPEEDEDPEEDGRTPLAPRIKSALRGLLTLTARRVVRRIGLHARRVAKDPAAFCAWLEGFRNEHAIACSEMLTPVLQLAEACLDAPSSPAGHTIALLDVIHAGLDALASKATPANLASEVDRHLTIWEETYPAEFAARILGESP